MEWKKLRTFLGELGFVFWFAFGVDKAADVNQEQDRESSQHEPGGVGRK